MNEARPGQGIGGGHPQQSAPHPAHPAHPVHPAQPLHPANPARPAPQPAPVQPAFRASVTGVLPAKAPPASEVESIELEEADDSPPPAATGTAEAAPVKSKIHAFSVLGATQKTHNWKRPTHNSGHGACRMRSFHGRLSEQGLEYLDNAINEWLDGHPDVDVKFVTSTVGQFDGKIKEPALILNIWY
jgi:hypothetical protein